MRRRSLPLAERISVQQRSRAQARFRPLQRGVMRCESTRRCKEPSPQGHLQDREPPVFTRMPADVARIYRRQSDYPHPTDSGETPRALAVPLFSCARNPRRRIARHGRIRGQWRITDTGGSGSAERVQSHGLGSRGVTGADQGLRYAAGCFRSLLGAARQRTDQGPRAAGW